MARLDDLLAQRDTLTARWFEVSRGLTRIPEGSRLAQLTTPRPGNGVGPSTGSAGGVTTIAGPPPARALFDLGTGAFLANKARGALMGALPTGLLPEVQGAVAPEFANLAAFEAAEAFPVIEASPTLGAAEAGAGLVAGAPESASALASAATTAGGAAGVAGGGLEAAQAAAAAADLYGQSGNLLYGVAGFTPGWGALTAATQFPSAIQGGKDAEIAGAGIKTAMSLVPGGAIIVGLGELISFLTGLGNKRPSAQSRADQALRASQLAAGTALRGAQTAGEIDAILGPLSGTTRATVADPASIARLFQDTSTFGTDLGGSSKNIAQLNLLDAVARTTPLSGPRQWWAPLGYESEFAAHLAGKFPPPGIAGTFASAPTDRVSLMNRLPPTLRALHPDVVHTNAVRQGIIDELGYFDLSRAIPGLAGDAEGQARAMAMLNAGRTLADVQLGTGAPRHVEGVHPERLGAVLGPGYYSTPEGPVRILPSGEVDYSARDMLANAWLAGGGAML